MTTKASRLSPEEAKISPFLYNDQFFVLAIICSLPLLYFGGERLFGIATLCFVTVYIFQISFMDVKSSVIGFVICVAIMQLCILYSVLPLLWQSLFNLILLLVYNLFIILTGGLGLLQFQGFRKNEYEFCANIEYFLFLLYPPCCVVITTWVIAMMFGSFLAPYVLLTIGFPVCYSFLSPKFRRSFSTKENDDIFLGQPEKMLSLLNYVLAPSFVYCLVNFPDLRLSSWISVLFCVCVPLFLVTFVDTTDLRDMADIRNCQWQMFQLFTGCLSLILCAILGYIHGIVDQVNIVFLSIIFVSSTFLFVAVKYRCSNLIMSAATVILASSYLLWFTRLPWNLTFSIGNDRRLEILILTLAILSAVALVVSLSKPYAASFNYIFLSYNLGFVLVETVLLRSKVYPRYLMIISSVLVHYTSHRLHQVHRLTKQSSIISSAFHGTKLLHMITTSNSHPFLNAFASLLSIIGGFFFSLFLVNITLYEQDKNLRRDMVLRYVGAVFTSLLTLSTSFLHVVCAVLAHGEPSFADIVGLIFILTACCFAKLAFLHSNDVILRKESVLALCFSFLFYVLQPQLYPMQILMHIPKVTFREVFYDTWQVVLAEYILLPWCLLIALSLVLMITLRLLTLKGLSTFYSNLISVAVGSPIGLYCAHFILPYPKLPTSILSIPYVISATITVGYIVSALKRKNSTSDVKIYVMFLGSSMVSFIGEMIFNVQITILQSKIPPSVLYQILLNFIIIVSESGEDLHMSLEEKKQSLSCFPRNCSILLILLSGLIFTPKVCYDITIVPLCCLILMLKIHNWGFKKNEETALKLVILVGVLGVLLYGRLFSQLPYSKWSFVVFLSFLLEASVILCSLLVYLVVLTVFWYKALSRYQEVFIVLFSPVFTLLLFYGRTSAGRTLGVIGPLFAYIAYGYR